MELKLADIDDLMKNSKSEEEYEFCVKLENLILQIRQAKLIEEGVF